MKPLFDTSLVQRRRLKAGANRTCLEVPIAQSFADRLTLTARSFHKPIALDLVDPPLSLEDQSVDLVTSSLALHWITDLPDFLAEVKRILMPNGLFMAGFIGGESLYELRESLLQAELELRGGASPRLSPFVGVKDAGLLLQRAGFDLPVVDMERHILRFPTLQSLLEKLKILGETNALRERDRRFPPRKLFSRCSEIYRDRFAASTGMLPLTVEVIYLSGWGPVR